MQIVCSNCVLRQLVASDAPSLAHHANNIAIARNLRDRFPHPYRIEDAEWYIAHVAGREMQTSFAITVDDVVVGSISLMPGDDVERRTAEVGYWLGEEFWGRGIATEALRGITEYAFRTLHLTRVFAVPFTTSVSSVRVLEKAGFICEGRLRRSAIKNGQILDQWIYARCDDQ